MFRKWTAVLLAGCMLLLTGCNRTSPNFSDTTSSGSAGSGEPTVTIPDGTKPGVDWKPTRPKNDTTPAVVPEDFINSNKTGVLRGLTGLNFIDDTTPWPEVSPVSPKDTKKRVSGQPYVVNTKYDDGMSLCVALYNVVEDFNAVNDGSRSASGAIQQALQAAKKAGGGVVYIPEGVYLCDKPLDIPSGVTLRGEWVSPEKAKPGSCGTVLLITGNRARESGTPQFRLNAGAGLRNMTILYPDQKAGAIEKYPTTIQEVAGGDSYTVMNITIAGAWNAYNGASGWSELHYLKNVYITAFNRAIQLDNVTDIGRIEGVHISPSYLTGNAYAPFTEADAQSIRDYMFKNATGLYILRSDWEYVYDFSAEGLSCGFVSLQNKEGRSVNAQFMKMSFKNCKIAINVEYTNAIGLALTDVSIEGGAHCEAGIRLGENFTYTVQFENLRISGPIQEQISYKGSGRVLVTNGVFQGWDTSSRYAVNMHRGSISLQQCQFKGKAKHITATSRCGGISVLGCTFEGKKDISVPNRSTYTLIDDTKLNLPVSRGLQHTYRQSIPRPSSMYIYNVADYGAVSKKDSTEAFRKALEAARKTGGIVYVPAGEFIVNQPLTIPSGVELRGIYDVPTHSKTPGSTICTSWGKNDENAKAFIQLEEGSGVNGISFYYPEQSYTKFIPYSWTVKSLGKNCWVINTVFINSYNALDFGSNPSDGHYIQYVSGAPIRRGLFVGNNASNGWVENTQFNPHYWKRATLTSKPSSGEEEFNNLLNQSLDAMILGDNASEHMLGNFAYAAKNVLLFISQGGRGTNGLIIGHGSDGCRNAMVVEQVDTVVMINAELVSMNASGDMHHIWMKESVTGTVGLLNTMMWAQPTSSLRVQGGTLIMGLSQYHNMEQAKYILESMGGTTYLSTMLMVPKDTQVMITGGNVELLGCLIKQSLSFVPPSGGAVIKIQKKGGYSKEAYTWWA